MPQVSILLANPHPIIRSNLRLLLEREPGLQVVAEAANGREAVILAEYRRPRVVLLDINLPLVSGIAAAREILAKNGQATILFVAPYYEEAYADEALKTGARGYVVEDCAETELARAIGAVLSGELFVSSCVRNQANALPAHHRSNLP